MQEVAQTASTIEVINQFNDAFNRHDVQAVMALMTEDCIFDNTYPPPDGERFEGQESTIGQIPTGVAGMYVAWMCFACETAR